MATTRALSNVTTVLNTIDSLQTQLAEQYLLLGEEINKITVGKQYAGESNVAFIKYWCQVAIDHPEILTGDFPKEAYVERLPYYERLIRVYKKDKQDMAILNNPTSYLSQDLIFCANAVYAAVKSRNSNPVFKKILQDSPQVYKKTKPDEGGAAVAKNNPPKALPQAVN